MIGIVGATGFVGTHLAALVRGRGAEPVLFSRRPQPGWRVIPPSGEVDLSGIETLINLAGEPVLGLWTRDKRRRIVASRIEGTRRLVDAILREGSVRTFVNASAIGYYGDTGERVADESAAPGTGFLAETCVAWEREADRAESVARVVKVRIGFVLGRGGAMRLVLPLFRAGLGGVLGSGRQWMSCIHVDDVAGLCLWAADEPGVSGPVNAVMPEPVTNAAFTRAVARAVHRPAILPAPAFALRAALGGMSSILLDSTRVVPAVAGNRYAYRYPTLESALAGVVSPK